MDYHLKLSRVREFDFPPGFPCFQQSSKPKLKLIFSGPILIEMSNRQTITQKMTDQGWSVLHIVLPWSFAVVTFLFVKI